MFARQTAQRLHARHGSICVLVALSLTLLLGLLTLSVETGRVFEAKRRMQSACDAAALGAATEIYRSVVTDPTEPTRKTQDPSFVAQQLAALNGFTGSDSTQVTVSIPPRSGSYAGANGFVQVEIQSRVKRTFSAVFGSGDVVVKTSSVAGGTLVPTKASLLVLEKKADHSLKLKGRNSSLTVQGDAIVNSKHKRALQIEDKARLKADAVMVTGGMDRKSKGFLDGDLFTGVQPTPDPYTYLNPPEKGPKFDQKDFMPEDAKDRQVYELPPGNYKSLKFDHADVVTMQPGTYEIDDLFEIKDDASLVAQDVTIYSKKGHFHFKTKGTVELTPPTSGPYANIAIYADRSAKQHIQFQKDSHYAIRGVIYAPGCRVEFKHSNAIFAGSDENSDDDGSDESDFLDDTDLGGDFTYGSMGASIVARKVSVDDHSQVQILGSDIAAQRPFLGVVE